jgi:hypothetical protein
MWAAMRDQFFSAAEKRTQLVSMLNGKVWHAAAAQHLP